MAQHGSVKVGDVVGVVLGGSGVQLPQGVDDFARLEDVQLVEVAAHVVLHVLDHASNVRNVRLGVRQTRGQAGLWVRVKVRESKKNQQRIGERRQQY